PMTYLIASNMMSITCSPGAWLHWHQCMIDWEGNGTSQLGQRRKASPVNLRSTGEAFRRWLGWTSASVDWEVNLRITLSGVSSPRPENPVAAAYTPMTCTYHARRQRRRDAELHFLRQPCVQGFLRLCEGGLCYFVPSVIVFVHVSNVVSRVAVHI